MGIEQFFLSYANSMIFHSIHVLGIVWVFPNNFYSGFPQRNSIVWELSHSQSLVIAWVPINSKSVRQSRTQKLSVFSHTCFLIWEFTHPVVWDLYGFLLHIKYLGTHNFEMFVFSQIFSFVQEFPFPMFWELYGFTYGFTVV